MNKKNFRSFGKHTQMSNNTWETGINNNDLIVGPSGSGKTRGYVIPNLLQGNDSIIVTDTKGNLEKKYSKHLEERGYTIVSIDIKNMMNSKWGYNPLDFIERKAEGYEEANEQDIIKLASCLAPVRCLKDPFWENSVQLYFQAIISYILKYLPTYQHNLTYVGKMCDWIGTNAMKRMFKEAKELSTNFFGSQRYEQANRVIGAHNTFSCIMAFVSEKLGPYTFEGARRFFSNEKRIDFKKLGKKKTAVFLNVSDTDRSMDSLVSLFYIQALQELCKEADQKETSRLKVPVRIIMDDFAANTFIEDFDKIISVIRSRDIYVSIIVQSLSQLEGMYGKAKATTIINNCDNLLYLGGTDIDTADYISIKANKTTQTILNMPLNRAYLFTRGQEMLEIEKDNPEHYLEELELEKIKKSEVKNYDPVSNYDELPF